MRLSEVSADMQSLRAQNYDVVEDDEGNPRVVEQITIRPPYTDYGPATTGHELPTPVTTKKGRLTTADDTQHAADIGGGVLPADTADTAITREDTNSGTGSVPAVTTTIIGHCNHCHIDITLEDKPKLRSLIIRKDNEKVVDVNRLYYGVDNKTGDVLVSEVPDVLEVYYGNRKPNLKGALAQLFGPGSTKALLSYVESDPIHGVTYSYTKDSYRYGSGEIMDDGNYLASTKYTKDEEDEDEDDR